MRCEQALSLLDLVRDDPSAGDDLEQARAHIETCPRCRAVLQQMRAIEDALPEALATPCPAPLPLRALVEARREIRQRRSQSRRFLRWAVAAAILLGAFCAFHGPSLQEKGGLRFQGQTLPEPFLGRAQECESLIASIGSR